MLPRRTGSQREDSQPPHLTAALRALASQGCNGVRQGCCQMWGAPCKSTLSWKETVGTRREGDPGLRISPSPPVLPLTRVCLSVGEERASTRSFGQILSIRSCSIWRGMGRGSEREAEAWRREGTHPESPGSEWHTGWLLQSHVAPMPLSPSSPQLICLRTPCAGHVPPPSRCGSSG